MTVIDAVAGWLARSIAALTVPMVLCLVVVSVIHYLCAAAAARAAAGVPLPFGELVATQFAASAANRLTPAGLGGAALNGRFFHRRGRLDGPQAAAAVSTLAFLGGASDVLAFAAIVGLGTLVGFAGASHEVPLLVSKVVGLVPVPSASWLWPSVVAAAVVAAGVALAVTRSRGRGILQRVASAAGTYRAALVGLARRPVRLAGLVGASAGTTVVLAAGFATVSTIGPAHVPVAGFCALMIGFMLASAAGNAIPTPGGIGATDAAQAGVLLAAGVAASPALATVLAFRLLTYWAPAVVGLAVARPLRKRGAF